MVEIWRSAAPYSAFPYIALAIVAMAAVIAFVVVHRHRPRAPARDRIRRVVRAGEPTRHGAEARYADRSDRIREILGYGGTSTAGEAPAHGEATEPGEAPERNGSGGLPSPADGDQPQAGG